ncbi:MAG: GMP synthase [Calditrichaeota bacterium]|nr:GMP synthase [Calditrichota bacterium]MCB9066352.1 GMP synthase [Calditrichia bacterium]
MRLPPVKIAVLDLYNNEPNQGMRCIKEIVGNASGSVANRGVMLDIYDTRYKTETPGLDYDIYISTGGPGSPYDGVGMEWENRYFRLIDAIWNHNEGNPESKKFVFFICHSFQMMARFFKFAVVQERDKRSFGIIPVVKTASADNDSLFNLLPRQFYVADFRQFEVISPNEKQLAQLGGNILARELQRVNPKLERALMGVRISNEMIGTQFHPEADPMSMLYHFRQPERKHQVVTEHGEEKYYDMIAHLEDPENILLTRERILPRFLRHAMIQLTPDEYLSETTLEPLGILDHKAAANQ